jgi:hypothetical protein
VEPQEAGLWKSVLAAVRQIEERDGLRVRQSQRFGDFSGFRAHGRPFARARLHCSAGGSRSRPGVSGAGSGLAGLGVHSKEGGNLEFNEHAMSDSSGWTNLVIRAEGTVDLDVLDFRRPSIW